MIFFENFKSLLNLLSIKNYTILKYQHFHTAPEIKLSTLHFERIFTENKFIYTVKEKLFLSLPHPTHSNHTRYSPRRLTVMM